MKKNLIAVAAAAAFIATGTMLPSCNKTNKMEKNPFLEPYTTEYEIPPFEEIEYEHYLPALEAGIAQKTQEIADIVANPEPATFDNTIMPLERSGEILEKVAMVFFALDESNSSDEMVEIAETFYPKYSQFSDEITMNDSLFQRIKTVYDNRESLDPDQKRAVEDYYKEFARNGALLSPEKKAELKEVNTELANLYLTFNKNLLNATNDFSIVVEDSARLAGLPESSIAVAADEAKNRGLEGKWVFTLHAPSRLPLLQYGDDRELRREMYEGYTTLASSGQYNNLPVINSILKARAHKAQLLGYKGFRFIHDRKCNGQEC